MNDDKQEACFSYGAPQEIWALLPELQQDSGAQLETGLLTRPKDDYQSAAGHDVASFPTSQAPLGPALSGLHGSYVWPHGSVDFQNPGYQSYGSLLSQPWLDESSPGVLFDVDPNYNYSDGLNPAVESIDSVSFQTLPRHEFIQPFIAREDSEPWILPMEMSRSSTSSDDTRLLNASFNINNERAISSTPAEPDWVGSSASQLLYDIVETNRRTEKAPRRRPPRKALVARRAGPLDTRTRKKADEMRDIGACWRCRKYKKPCDGSEVCESCMVPGFRIWPSSLGCRRERLESLVLFLLPSHMEQKLQIVPVAGIKPKTWRVLQNVSVDGLPESLENSLPGQWALSKREASSIKLFGADYAELAEIAERYQSLSDKPIKALESSCTLLIATCQLYKSFITTSHGVEHIDPLNLMKNATAVRVALRRTFVLIQQLCLSNKRTAWFPAFLSAALATCSAIIFLDTAIAVPSPAREMIWGNLHDTRTELRDGGYGLLIDVLRACTNGINPLKQKCWETSVGDQAQELINRKERQVLLGNDTVALEGVAALKAWQDKYRPDLDQGQVMFAAQAYAVARLRPIAGLCKIIDF